MKRSAALRQKQAEIYKKMQALTDGADAENRDFNPEEQSEWNKYEEEYKQLDNRCEREERLEGYNADLDKVQGKVISEPAGQTQENRNAKTEEKRVWKSFGEQLAAIAQAATPGGRTDPRLITDREERAGTGLNEAIPSDGGFLVQSDFASEILQKAYNQAILGSRVRRVPISAKSNGLVINAVDETSRASGSRLGGLQLYWVAEGGTATPSKPKFRQLKLNLNKLMGLCYITEEQLEDSVALESLVSEGFANEFAFVIDDAIIRGDGAGKPLGFLNHASTVIQTKVSGQTNGTVNKENIFAMRSRLLASLRGNAIWLINQDVEPQLNALALGDLGVYFPGGSFVNQPEDRLFARPVFSIEQCETLGTKGDIMFVDPSQYIMIEKGGLKTASSVHVRFLYDEMVYKFTYRVDGQPSWNTVLTAYKGSATKGPAVVLENR